MDIYRISCANWAVIIIGMALESYVVLEVHGAL